MNIDINWKNVKINNRKEDVSGYAIFKNEFSEEEISTIQNFYRQNKKNVDFKKSIKINNKYYKNRTELCVHWNNHDPKCKKEKTLGFIMFNPSFANPEKPDTTIQNVIKYSDKFGYNSVIIYNLFSIRVSGANVVSNYYNNLEEYSPEIYTENLPDDVVLAWGKLPQGIKGVDTVIDNLYQNLKSKKLYQITDEDFQRHPAIISTIGGIKNLLLFPIEEGKIYKFEAS